MSTVRIPILFYKGNFEKYKGKFCNSVFWHFKLLNQFACWLISLVCIPDVLTHLWTPILPYVDMTFIRCRMCHLCQKCQKCHIWPICHLPYEFYRYGKMGVKRCAMTSAMATNAFEQLLNRFKVLKFQNNNFRNFCQAQPSFNLNFSFNSGWV